VTGSRLTRWEATNLLHVVCERVAHDAGVPLLAIKGPALTLQGLRDAQDSADVDVLVHPDTEDTFVDRMEMLGWRVHADPPHLSVTGPQPVSLLHDHWPVAVDVRRRVPGFLDADPQVFDNLWARRVSLLIAGMPVTTCDRASHVVVAGLHLLSDGSDGAVAQFEDLALRARTALQAHERAVLRDLVVSTTSSEAMRLLLDRLEITGEAPSPPAPPASEM
jgi:hypothetical protein